METNKQLRKLGYRQDYIDLISDPAFKGRRLSPENVLFMENLIGKTVTIVKLYSNVTLTSTVKVNNISLRVTAGSIFFDGGVCSAFTPSVIDNFKNNEFVFSLKDKSCIDGIVRFYATK